MTTNPLFLLNPHSNTKGRIIPVDEFPTARQYPRGWDVHLHVFGDTRAVRVWSCQEAELQRLGKKTIEKKKGLRASGVKWQLNFRIVVLVSDSQNWRWAGAYE